MPSIIRLLKRIETALLQERPESSKKNKLLLAEMVVRLRSRRKKRFGLFVIFGWRNVWNKNHADIPDDEQDIFAHHRVNVFRFHRRGFKKIVSTVNFDGAILIDPAGNILHSGIVIEGLHPRLLANKLSPRSSADLSTRLGFRKKVHTRHLSAIAASYIFKGTTVFTVSEETGDIHIFEKGRIIFSTTPEEAGRRF